MEKLSVLIVDTNESRRVEIDRDIRGLGYIVFSTSDPEAGAMIYENIQIDILLHNDITQNAKQDLLTKIMLIGSPAFPWVGMTPEEIEKALRA